MKVKLFQRSLLKLIGIFLLFTFNSCKNQNSVDGKQEPPFVQIQGWAILSDNEKNAYEVINAAKDYDINHLQLSHHIIHDLREIKSLKKQTLCNKIVNYAHEKKIQEVTVWDHALYPLEYYPDEFKTEQNNTIDLDNDAFWEWLKNDYREMLDLIPNIDGIVLTFIETGARVEDQFSVKLQSPAEKLAKVVNEIAEVVIEERNLRLYARTFIYTKKELSNILSCIDKIQNEKVILMVKEVPHDFFLTHPVQSYIDQLNRPVIIEFDAGHEYSGQGIIANTFVEKTAERWRFYQQKSNVIGYVARTDRYGDTRIIDRPSEILLFTLFALNQNPDIINDQIYDDFISLKYGKEVVNYLKPAFKSAYDIVTSSLYTLGLCMANHSALSCDYQSIYNRYVSGRWMDIPLIHVNHGINKSFHYYIDVVNHLAPKHLKQEGARLYREDPFVRDSLWIKAEDLMNKEYLEYIILEKNFSITLAEKSLKEIEKSKPYLADFQYKNLFQTYYRTLIKACLSRGAAKAYFSYRIWAAYSSERDQKLLDIFWEGIDEMKAMYKIVEEDFNNSPRGQWTWQKDLKTVNNYIKWMTQEGWDDYGSIIIFSRQHIRH